MSERIKVAINGGKVYDVELDKVLQSMVNLVDKFANEADALRSEIAELREAMRSAYSYLADFHIQQNAFRLGVVGAGDIMRATARLKAVLDKYK